jgi:cellulose synthase/poly-beta-1,6-N-acetylglucosamine synthase-like glycosyltransferase
MSQLNPILSVVVIGRNEGPRLRRCLESITAMDTIAGGYEIVYVDSGSTDNSLAVAAEFGAKVLTLGSERPTAARARNKGWRSARARWILFLDGDTILNPSFPRTALASAQGQDVGALFGHRREIYPNANAFQRVLDLDWVSRLGRSEFCGGDALMRRSALETAGGFDDDLIAGEEPELCTRLRAHGYFILHIDAPMTLHDLAISRWRQYWRRASRTGYAYAQMAWRTRGNEIRLWTRESSHNRSRALILILGAFSLVAGSIISPLVAATGILLGCFIVVRSAWKSRWKSDSVVSLLLYGIHSHVQQIPIFAGQLEFQLDLMRNRRRELIEYK